MNSFTILLYLACLLLFVDAKPLREDVQQHKFADWMAKFHKKYSVEDFWKRYQIFAHNLDYVETHNKQVDRSFTMSLDHMADMSAAERKQAFSGIQQKQSVSDNGNRVPDCDMAPATTQTAQNTEYEHYVIDSSLVDYTQMAAQFPTRMDWREKGAVTPVMSQGGCLSCWSFSTTGAMSAAVFLQGQQHKLIDLSKQELVDCAHTRWHCMLGNYPPCAYKYTLRDGLSSEHDYPYLGRDEGCRTPLPPRVSETIKGWNDIKVGDENALMMEIQHGPVAVAIDQSGIDFYQSGVVDNITCHQQAGHALLLVGYGTDTKLGKDYWLLRNSFSDQWGENGYVRMVRGKDMCHITELANRPWIYNSTSSVSRTYTNYPTTISAVPASIPSIQSVLSP
eukprot:TRINITY_DN10716_c0_g1_i1.p1 TRINITY_DN10716_c0_g1~~TRINITY_DN10716_c0_g1_i1.p1  ORF type:complete len:401 (+),score=89.16 TRINITY_DN10716_c0_g1_i1:26-1204(+)